jgi:hypothetical protein
LQNQQNFAQTPFVFSFLIIPDRRRIASCTVGYNRVHQRRAADSRIADRVHIDCNGKKVLEGQRLHPVAELFPVGLGLQSGL